MSQTKTIPALPPAPLCLGHSPATPIRVAMREAAGLLEMAETLSRVGQCDEVHLDRRRAKLALLEAWRALVEYGDVQGRPWLVGDYSKKIESYLDARAAYEG